MLLTEARPLLREHSPPIVCRAFAARGGTVMAVTLRDGYAVQLGAELLPERYGTRAEVVAAVMKAARG